MLKINKGMFEIKKLPVLILSTPRSGSNALTLVLWKQAIDKHPNCYYFSEPDYLNLDKGSVNINGLNEFYKVCQTTDNFVVKCHYFRFVDVYRQDIRELLLSKAFKIRLRRKNIISQIASVYIANRNNKYVYSINDSIASYNVPIDENHIKKIIEFLRFSNSAIDNAEIDFDLNLYYEDLENLNQSGHIESIKPQNYRQLCDCIAEIHEKTYCSESY